MARAVALVFCVTCIVGVGDKAGAVGAATGLLLVALPVVGLSGWLVSTGLSCWLPCCLPRFGGVGAHMGVKTGARNSNFGPATINASIVSVFLPMVLSTDSSTLSTLILNCCFVGSGQNICDTV